MRDLLLAKEDKVTKLQQVKRWVDDLYQQEPHRRNKIIAKKAVVCNMLNQTLAKAGELVYKLSRGCDICNTH